MTSTAAEEKNNSYQNNIRTSIGDYLEDLFACLFCTYVHACVHAYLIVRAEDELEEEDEANEDRPGIREAKACVHVLLVHKEAKQEQKEKKVQLEGNMEERTYTDK